MLQGATVLVPLLFGQIIPAQRWKIIAESCQINALEVQKEKKTEHSLETAPVADPWILLEVKNKLCGASRVFFFLEPTPEYP